MTTTSLDERALLAAICAHPDEDTPRLVYADWLDENGSVSVKCPDCEGKGGDHHGWGTNSSQENCPRCGNTGFVLDTSNASRAEFIRVQCEWERLKYVSHPNTDDGRAETWRILSLDSKAKQLLTAHEAAWRRAAVCERCAPVPLRMGLAFTPYNPDCPDCRGTGDLGGLLRKFTYSKSDFTGLAEPVHVTFARGFPDVVRCELGEVVERVKVGGNMNLPDMHRITDWARRVVRYHPVRGFRVTDREPVESVTGWWWSSSKAVGHPASLLPDEVFYRLPGVSPSSVLSPSHPTPEAAHDVLACALALLARKANATLEARR